VRAVFGGPTVAEGLRLPLLWRLQGLAFEAKSRDPGMRWLRTTDIQDGRHGNAQPPFAIADMVSRRAHHHQSFKRDVGAATLGPTWPRQLQDGVAAVAQAAAGNGRS